VAKQSSTPTEDPMDVIGNEPSTEVPTQPEGEAPAPAGEATKASKKSRLTPPEGYVTPVGLAHEISKQRGIDPELRPQQVYGWLKNNKNFPAVDSTTLGESESRPLVKLEDGLKFYDDLQNRKAERETKKATPATAATPEGEAPASENAEASA
jgi:hypothetical protein